MHIFLLLVIFFDRGSRAVIEMYTGSNNGPTETYMVCWCFFAISDYMFL